MSSSYMEYDVHAFYYGQRYLEYSQLIIGKYLKNNAISKVVEVIASHFLLEKLYIYFDASRTFNAFKMKVSISKYVKYDY